MRSGLVIAGFLFCSCSSGSVPQLSGWSQTPGFEGSPTAVARAELTPEQVLATVRTSPAIVSFTFDDGYRSQLTQAAPILAVRGFAATEFVATFRIGGAADEWGSPFLSWEDVAVLRDRFGWEIASHSITHPLLETVDQTQVDDELLRSHQILAEHGFETVGFAAPYGSYDDRVLSRTATRYRYFRPFHDTEKLNELPVDRSLLWVKQVQVGVTVEQVVGWIDEAARRHAWLILVLHEIQPRSAAVLTAENVAWGYAYPSTDLGRIADHCVSAGVAVLTPAQVLTTPRPPSLIANGSFELGLSGFRTDRPLQVRTDSGGYGALPEPQHTIALIGDKTGAHLFGPQVPVQAGQEYTLEIFVNAAQLASGTVGFYVDEYDAFGTWVSGQYIRDVPESGRRKVQHVAFTYGPSAGAKTAALQIILSPDATGVAFVDEVSWVVGRTP